MLHPCPRLRGKLQHLAHYAPRADTVEGAHEAGWLLSHRRERKAHESDRRVATQETQDVGKAPLRRHLLSRHVLKPGLQRLIHFLARSPNEGRAEFRMLDQPPRVQHRQSEFQVVDDFVHMLGEHGQVETNRTPARALACFGKAMRRHRPHPEAAESFLHLAVLGLFAHALVAAIIVFKMPVAAAPFAVAVLERCGLDLWQGDAGRLALQRVDFRPERFDIVPERLNETPVAIVHRGIQQSANLLFGPIVAAQQGVEVVFVAGVERDRQDFLLGEIAAHARAVPVRNLRIELALNPHIGALFGVVY